MGRFNYYLQPEKVKGSLAPAPNLNDSLISSVSTHSTVSIGESVLDQQFQKIFQPLLAL